MARESRRKRDARRFGEGRLADRLLGERWQPTAYINDEYFFFSGHLRDCISTSVLIDAENVCRYWADQSEAKGEAPWLLDRDFPTPVPPFPVMLIECQATRQYESLRPGAQWAWLITDEKKENWPPGADEPGIARLATATLFYFAGGVPTWPMAIISLKYRDDGSLAEFRSGLYGDPSLCREPDLVRSMTNALAPTMLLALSFMNCKNVSLEAIEPDREANRERRRAGMRPLVRYHTINIEPMKKVLRTEGGVEHNGLKKALHICRGHFATYSDRMFGRDLEKPVTVWKPAHVRGSLRHGVVVSDYNVSPPR